MNRAILLLLCCLAVPAAMAQDARRAMTTDDALELVTHTNVLLSPDGASVFFGKSELDWDKNKRKTTYHMVPAAGGEAFPYIGEAGGSDFKFSPDGAFLAFKRPVEKKAQLFVMRTRGGEAQQLTKHKEAVGSYAWAPDASGLFFVANEARSKEDEKEHKNGADAIIVDEGPNGQQAARWQNLWHVDRKTAKIKRLTKENHRVGGFAVAPDGQRLAFTARTENRRNQGNQSEIYLYDRRDSTTVRLTENEAPEGGLQWAPDGKHLAFTAADDQAWELRNAKIWVMDVAARTSRLVSGSFEGSIRRFAWTPDAQRILFNGLQRTNTNLYHLDVASGVATQVTGATGTLQIHAFSKDRSRMVYSYSNVAVSPDLYVSPTDRLLPTRLTTSNPVADSLLLARGEVIRWNSTDSTEIEGLLLLPAGYDGAARLPLLLHIHGGPAGVYTNSFRASNHVWAGLGYAQLFPNVRGSSGYSDELLRGNMQDIGGGDYDDLMTGVDHVIERGIADPDRLALRGWSYGGILGGWTITQTNRFKAASIGAGVYDWASEYGPGFNYDVRLWYIGGTPWENPEGWRQKSALTHVENVQTPTILFHGMNDRTDTEAQSMMFFAALKDMGKAVRYIRFPREGHGIREPRHQRVRDIEEIRWIQQHARGLDWQPWERKQPKPTDAEETSKPTAATRQ